MESNFAIGVIAGVGMISLLFFLLELFRSRSTYTEQDIPVLEQSLPTEFTSEYLEIPIDDVILENTEEDRSLKALSLKIKKFKIRNQFYCDSGFDWK